MGGGAEAAHGNPPRYFRSHFGTGKRPRKIETEFGRSRANPLRAQEEPRSFLGVDLRLFGQAWEFL